MVKKSSRIAVIGGSGFIGSLLVKSLLKAGFEQITVLARHAPKTPIAGVRYESGTDLTDTEALIKKLQGAEIIFNLAGLVSFDRRDRDRLREINEDAVCRLIAAARYLPDLQRLIHLSSTAALGFGETPIDEASAFDFSKCPLLNYSRSKAVANPVIDASPVPTNIVFPPMVLGPGDEKNTSSIIQYVGKKRRLFVPPGSNSFVDVRDLATALILVMEKAPPNENYIVASGTHSYAEIFKTAAKVRGNNPDIFVLPDFFFLPSFAVARILERFLPNLHAENIYLGFKKREHDTHKIRALGFKSQYSLEDSLRGFMNNTTP